MLIFLTYFRFPSSYIVLYCRDVESSEYIRFINHSYAAHYRTSDKRKLMLLLIVYMGNIFVLPDHLSRKISVLVFHNRLNRLVFDRNNIHAFAVALCSFHFFTYCLN